jgi:hypothetical protein
VIEVRWPCCFCGKDIEKTKPDPCHITVATVDGHDQWWWCHADCFKAALTKDPEIKEIFEPAHF